MGNSYITLSLRRDFGFWTFKHSIEDLETLWELLKLQMHFTLGYGYKFMGTRGWNVMVWMKMASLFVCLVSRWWTIWKGLGGMAWLEEVCPCWRRVPGSGLHGFLSPCQAVYVSFCACLPVNTVINFQPHATLPADMLPAMIMDSSSKIVSKTPTKWFFTRVALLMVPLHNNRPVSKTIYFGHIYLPQPILPPSQRFHSFLPNAVIASFFPFFYFWFYPVCVA